MPGPDRNVARPQRPAGGADRLWGCLFGLLLLLAGCSPPPEVGSVIGLVTLDGEPLPEAFVRFEGEAGWQATAVTDDEGLYELVAGDGRLGAVVGGYKVIVHDARSFAAPTDKESDGDESPPPPAPRIPAVYGNIARTPLTANVEPGEQSIDLPLSSDAR